MGDIDFNKIIITFAVVKYIEVLRESEKSINWSF